MSRRAAWTGGLLWVIAAGCSSADKHPPGANNDCPVGVKCDRPYGGISSSGGGNPNTDSGTLTTDAGTTRTCGSDCVTDPTFGVALCAKSLVCPGVVVDRTNPALQNCGYVDLRGACAVADVECLCNGAFLCPISTAANCSTLPGLLSQQTDVCAPAMAANRCIALDTVPRLDAGRCTPLCLSTCNNNPTVCQAFCNC